MNTEYTTILAAPLSDRCSVRLIADTPHLTADEWAKLAAYIATMRHEAEL